MKSSLRWIPPICLGGRWQMAIDGWLLAQVDPASCVTGTVSPVLRVYRWSRPTLSLGHHQRHVPPHWWRLAEAGRLDLVRRPSGGRAVLHGFDLTYALIWPDPPRRRRQAYTQTCGWLQACFAAMGRPLHAGAEAHDSQPPSCFSSATEADLVHGDGSKRIGSAQFWRHGALLQHGSIQLNPPSALWREVFGEEPPALEPLPLGLEELIDLLRLQSLRHLPMAAGLELQCRDLSSDELAAIATELPRYGLSSCVGAATSPLVSIDRAT
ncbi:MAG: lipoyl protein ligase domain-containing protein [Synechococcaceae cyanobacterium]